MSPLVRYISKGVEKKRTGDKIFPTKLGRGKETQMSPQGQEPDPEKRAFSPDLPKNRTVSEAKSLSKQGW
jgi:hypothetical protein